MILDQEIRSQFSLLIFAKSLQQGNDLRAPLMKAGFEVFVFHEQDTVIQCTIESAPHMVIFFANAVEGELDPFIEKILSANAEIQFLAIGEASKALHFLAYRQFNLAAFVPFGENLEDRVLWEAENVCSQLYQGYLNEQLIEDGAQKSSENQTLSEELKKLKQELQMAPKSSIASLISNYQSVQSKEEILDAFVDQVEKLSKTKREKIQGVFFRFLPTVSSFVATHAIGIDIESLRGVGGRLGANEVQNLAAFLASGKIPGGLTQLLQGPLQVKNPMARPLQVQRAIEGLFVFWSSGDIHTLQPALDEAFLVFSLQYQLFHLSKRVDALNVEDQLTGLFNREQYNRKLDEEISRARRLKNAVSIIKLTVDHLAEHEQAQGMQQRDSVLRAVAALLRKTSRVNDVPCRTSENEFAIVLPHCARKGAAIRAERLRRMVESHDFGSHGIRITVSLGVSEYPTLSKSSSDLDRSSSEAMKFISERGGNKVCLYKAAEGFKPDYDVIPV